MLLKPFWCGNLCIDFRSLPAHIWKGGINVPTFDQVSSDQIEKKPTELLGFCQLKQVATGWVFFSVFFFVHDAQ